MEFALFIWAAGVVGKVVSMATAISIIFSIIIVLWNIGLLMREIETTPPIWMKVSVVLAMIISVITPSERTMWMMAGGYVGQSVVQSEASAKLVKIVELKLQSVLDEAETKASAEAKKIMKQATKE